MTIRELAKHIDAKTIIECDPDREIESACGADLMSDVLAFVKHNSVLLTGLINAHVIRTAEMIDVMCIVFVRGKRPPEDLCELAREREIDILATDYTLYEACGKLYAAGIPATHREEA